jgi:hypothetical protein
VIDPETALLTILGGVIAGVIGFAATWYDRHLAARSRHLEEHKRNLLVVSTSLVTLRNEIWPPTKNMANFEVVEGSHANVTAQFENFSLVNMAVWMRTSPEEGGYEFVYIDHRLFEDLSIHFPDLYRSLKAVDNLARTDGPRVLQPMYDLFDEIYKGLEGRTMTPLYPGEGSQAAGMNRRYLASATFNELTVTDGKDWPSHYSQIVAQQAAPDIETLAEDVRKSLGKRFDKWIKLRDATLGQLDKCLDAIDDVRLRHRLKHRCPYA